MAIGEVPVRYWRGRVAGVGFGEPGRGSVGAGAGEWHLEAWCGARPGGDSIRSEFSLEGMVPGCRVWSRDALPGQATSLWSANNASTGRRHGCKPSQFRAAIEERLRHQGSAEMAMGGVVVPGGGYVGGWWNRWPERVSGPLWSINDIHRCQQMVICSR